MMFASKTPDQILRDPEGDALIAAGDFCEEEVYGLIPEKFYNTANPILLDFRSIYHETTPTIYQGYWELAEIWLELLDEDPAMVQSRNWGGLVGIVTGGQIDHARRVLTRLANLTKESP